MTLQDQPPFYLLIFLISLSLAIFLQPTELTPSEQLQTLFDDTVEQIPVSKHNYENVVLHRNSIVFVGDVMLARNVEYMMSLYGYAYPFSAIAPFKSNQYVVGNFEASIPKTHNKTPVSGFSFSVDTQYLKGLKEFGFSHLGLANNHSYDFGSVGFENAQTQLTNNGLETFGDQRSQASSTISLLQLPKDIVALVGVYAVDKAPTQHEIEVLLQRASQGTTEQIVYIHWGTEYTAVHNSFQEKLAHQLIDAGADAVIGHHPHVTQDVELYKSKPIFYSLGNFIFDQYFSVDVQQGLMLDVAYTESTTTFTLIPVTSIGSRSIPRMMSSYEKDIFLKDVAKNSDAELTEMIISTVIELQR